jgi:hypothetical protein
VVQKTDPRAKESQKWVREDGMVGGEESAQKKTKCVEK